MRTILLFVAWSLYLFSTKSSWGQNSATACGQTVTYPLDGCMPCTQSLNNLNGSINFSIPNQTICVTGTSIITGINSTMSDTVRICGDATITGPLSSWGTPVNIIITSGSTLNWQIDPSGGASRNIINYGISNYNAGISNVNNVTYISASTAAQLNITGDYTLNGVNTFVFLGGSLNVTGKFTLNSSVNALCLSNNAIITTYDFETTADNNILVDPSFVSCISYSHTAVANGHPLSQDDLSVCQQVGASNPAYIGVSNFGPQVTVTSNCANCASILPLPIKLSSFTVTANNSNNTAQLQWVSAVEVNTDRFDIQRSSNGLSFGTIGMVNAAGNSSTAITYSYTDRPPVAGMSYYRLKMIDKDGKYSYSAIQNIMLASSNKFKLINSASNSLLFSLPQVEGKAFVKLVDLRGRVLWQQSIFSGQLQLTISIVNITEGSYFVQYRDSRKQQVQQVFIQHSAD